MIECSICKSSNDEHAAFCAECGQRLSTAQNSSKLHSPLLDSGFSQSQLIDNSHSELPLHVSGILPRPLNPADNNNLHSPLLDNANTGLDFRQTNNKSSRLHSPVLDGPGQSNQTFMPEDLDMPVEEYNSLRSPILAAKVPLPEAVVPAAELVIKPSTVNPAIVNPSVSQTIPQSKQPTIQSLFGVDPQLSQSDETYKQFASSLFDEPPQTSNNPFPAPKQTAVNFTNITSIKKEEKLDVSPGTVGETNQTKSKIVSGRSLLPREEEFGNYQLPSTGASKTGFKVTAFVCLLAALVFKFWYWQTLGTSLTSAPSFLSDQIGQVLIILLLFILILTAKF